MADAIQNAKPKLPTNRRTFVFICTCLVNVVVWADEVAFTTLVPFWSAHYGFDSVQIATIQSSYLLGYFPMLLLGGILADIIGPKKCLLAAVLMGGLLSAAMLLCNGYSSMYWRNFAFGLFFGLNWGPAMRMVAIWAAGSERATKASIWSLMSSVGTVVMGPIALMMASRTHFHNVFLLVLAISIPVFIMTLFTRDKPELYGDKISQEEVDFIYAGRDVEAEKNANFNVRVLGQIAKDPNLWLVLLATVFATGSTWSFGTWGTMVYLNVFGANPDLVGTMSSVTALVPVAFGFTAGFWLNKVFKGNIKLLLACTPILGTVPYLIASKVPGLPWIAVMLLVTVGQCTNSWGWGGSNAYFAAYARPELWGTLNGLAAMMQVAFGYWLTLQTGKWVTPEATLGGYGNILVYAGLIWFLATLFGLLAKTVYTTDTWETVEARKKAKKAAA